MKLSTPIDLEYNKQNFIVLLTLGSDENQDLYSHKQISEWCDNFGGNYFLDDDLDVPEEIEKILPVLTDVEAQWVLFLANTYSYEQLNEIDLEFVKLPCSWFQDWLSKIDT